VPIHDIESSHLARLLLQAHEEESRRERRCGDPDQPRCQRSSTSLRGAMRGCERVRMPEGVYALPLSLCLSRLVDGARRKALYSWVGTNFATSFSLTGRFEPFSRSTTELRYGYWKNRVRREVAKLEEDFPSESGVVDAVPDEEREERGLAAVLERVEHRLVEGARFGDEDHDEGAPLRSRTSGKEHTERVLY